MYCRIEIASDGPETVILCEMDGTYVSETRINNVSIELTWPLALVVGADMTGCASSTITMYQIILRGLTLDLAEREVLKASFYDLAAAAMGSTTALSYGIEYGDGLFHYSRGHPLLGRDLSIVSGDLIQEQDDWRPILVGTDGTRCPVGLIKSKIN